MGQFNELIPELRAFASALVDLAGRAGLSPRVTSTIRSRTQQSRLYRAYLAGRRRYPAAPPGTSAHEYGAALDLVVTPYDALYELGELWQSWGGIWSPKDDIHFEYPGWQSAALENYQPGLTEELGRLSGGVVGGHPLQETVFN
jgi:hypothetical protein